MHSLTSSTDLHSGVLLYLAIACSLAVAAAVIWRVAHAGREIPREERAAATLAMMSPAQRPPDPWHPARRPGPRAPRTSADRLTKADTR